MKTVASYGHSKSSKEAHKFEKIERPRVRYRLKSSISARKHDFSTGETSALMIKTLRVRKQIAQPHGMCQPFSEESRWIEIICGGQIPSTMAEDFG